MNKINVDDDTVLKTIPILTVSGVGKIKSFASGSIVQYLNKDIVLSVAHCTRENRLMGMNLSAYQGKPNVLFFQPMPIAVLTIKPKTKFVSPFMKLLHLKYNSLSDIALRRAENQYDMVYAEIPNHITPLHNVITSHLFNKPKIKIPINFPCTPNKQEKYKFYGLAFNCFAFGMVNFFDVSANDLTYIKDEGNCYVFESKQLPKNIDGCSGAPILDSNGNIVSMVIRHKDNYVWGLNLNPLKAVWDVSYGE